MRCPGIEKIELAQTIDDLKTFQSVAGNQHHNFELLDATVATDLKKIWRTTSFKIKGLLGRTESPKAGRFLRRQIVYMIREYLRITGTNEFILDY